ncbi:MAG: family 43 glycosylhydrolase, partial [Ruminococcus sp.]|nr:family 43 glycosylhydrolase [Ruminococcus sp.]
MNKALIAKGATLIISAAVFLSALPFSAFAESVSMTNAVRSLESDIAVPDNQISTDNYKDTRFNNPISPDFFCADPTAVEYNGRLYVYGTNDHQQFEAAGPDVDNTYEKIKSLLVFSTEDMVNWTYHGEINVGKIAPWISASWAPSIVSREEADGRTHFYLYFSNSGIGTGVITSTDPVTGWTDPLGHCLVTSNTPGLGDCPNPFDPGAVIDDNGVGWLSFGAGTASNGTDYMPGSVRIVR